MISKTLFKLPSRPRPSAVLPKEMEKLEPAQLFCLPQGPLKRSRVWGEGPPPGAQPLLQVLLESADTRRHGLSGCALRPGSGLTFFLEGHRGFAKASAPCPWCPVGRTDFLFLKWPETIYRRPLSVTERGPGEAFSSPCRGGAGVTGPEGHHPH